MTTTTKTVELACEDTHGGREHCGDFESFAVAIEEAFRLAADQSSPVHRDDFGICAFGITTDPLGGRYEYRLTIDHPNGWTMTENDAMIAGGNIDDRPKIV